MLSLLHPKPAIAAVIDLPLDINCFPLLPIVGSLPGTAESQNNGFLEASQRQRQDMHDNDETAETKKHRCHLYEIYHAVPWFAQVSLRPLSEMLPRVSSQQT